MYEHVPKFLKHPLWSKEKKDIVKKIRKGELVLQYFRICHVRKPEQVT